MIQREKAKAAVDELLATALLGESWEAALERFAAAVEAGGVVVGRHGKARPDAAKFERTLGWISSSGFVDVEAENWSGRPPPSPHKLYPLGTVPRGQFCFDQDLFSVADLARDPYFQEFLKPRDVFWRAKTYLTRETEEGICLTLKRHSKLGPYEPQDIAILNSLTGDLDAMARVARGVLDAEACGIIGTIGRGELTAFELDRQGRVLREHAGSLPFEGVRVRGARLVAGDELGQRSLDRAVAAAVMPPGRPGLVVFPDFAGEFGYLQTLPLPGRAREVFHAATAIAIVVEPNAPRGGASPRFRAACEAFALTRREAQLAARLTAGMSLGDAAKDLRLGVGTARNHLKSIFNKTGTSRQGELIALLCRLSH